MAECQSPRWENTVFKRRHPARGLRSLFNLKSGEGIEGVMTGRSGDHLKIHGATLHSTDSSPVPVEGMILVHESNVAYIQVAGA